MARSVRPVDWIAGVALLGVVGLGGTVGLQAMSSSTTKADTPTSETTDDTGRESGEPDTELSAAELKALQSAKSKGVYNPKAKPAAKPRRVALKPTKARKNPSVSIDFVVSSFNVLGSSHTKGNGRGKRGKASGVRRADGAARLLAAHDVAVVGLQELQWDQMRVLSSRLPGYGIYPGASMGAREAENSIMWRLDLFDLVESNTISIPYFRGNPRQMPYLKLRSRENGRELWVANFHNPATTPRWGNNARWRAEATRRQIALVRGLREAQPDVPVIFTGDMNDRAAYFCPVVGSGLMEAANGGSAGSGGCSLPPAPQIDWIFGTKDLEWSGYVVDRSPAVRWTTDHPMIRATALLPGSNAIDEAAAALQQLGDG